jgi:hypothetical protein
MDKNVEGQTNLGLFDSTKELALERLSARIVALECNPEARSEAENQARDFRRDITIRQQEYKDASDAAGDLDIDLADHNRQRILEKQYLARCSFINSGYFAGYFSSEFLSQEQLESIEQELGISQPTKSVDVE